MIYEGELQGGGLQGGLQGGHQGGGLLGGLLGGLQGGFHILVCRVPSLGLS